MINFPHQDLCHKPTRKWCRRWGLALCGGCWLHGGLDCCWWERHTVLVLHTYRKPQEFRVVGSGRVHCVIASRMGSSNLSFIAKSCACACIVFVASIISLSVD
jgi:hypothetical protein